MTAQEMYQLMNANPVFHWTIVNKVDRKIKKAIQIGLETKGY